MSLHFLGNDTYFFISIAISLFIGLISVYLIRGKMKSKGIDIKKSYIEISIIAICFPILLFPILFYPYISNRKKIFIVFLTLFGLIIQVITINKGIKYIKDRFRNLDNVE
jgi:uncharacterized membrane protein